MSVVSFNDEMTVAVDLMNILRWYPKWIRPERRTHQATFAAVPWGKLRHRLDTIAPPGFNRKDIVYSTAEEGNIARAAIEKGLKQHGWKPELLVRPRGDVDRDIQSRLLKSAEVHFEHRRSRDLLAISLVSGDGDFIPTLSTLASTYRNKIDFHVLSWNEHLHRGYRVLPNTTVHSLNEILK